MKLAISLCCVLLVHAHPPSFASDNWPQWRGPGNSGVSETATPPVTWSETENIKWKVSIDGSGTSTPIVWEDRVFVLTAIKTAEKDASIPDPKDQPKTNFFDIKRPNAVHEFAVICLDRSTGKELWRDIATKKIPHEGAHNDNDFASASPTTDGQRLYCWFGSAGLFCYDLNGTRLWQRDLGEAKVGSSLGEGSSPVLHEGRLIIVRDHSGQSTIEVLEAETGKTVWRKDREEGNAWATPLVVEHSGRTQVITSASNFVRSYDLESGDVIWQCGGLTGNCTPCPQVQGDYVICMSGYQGYSALAIPLSETGDISKSKKIAWSLSKGTPYVPSSVLYDGLLYFNQSNQAILRCVDATSGDVVFGPQRINGLRNIYSSPVAAGGHIYIVGRGGTTVVLKHSRSYEPVATNKLNERFDASPAIAGDQIFLRGVNHLYCIEQD
ncbi:MAG: PQQ-like beta-propeller repeat protein [Planctomycetaceae bacterium]|nr:PQQ-like beta-propeller repeat protein [Planctomycetaceae bacterium]